MIARLLAGTIGIGALLAFADTGMGNGSGGPPQVDGQPQITPSGLQYIEVAAGSGPAATAGQRVSVHYTGWLTTGQKFDSSRDRGQPFSFQIGGRVIQGWNEGVAGMMAGGQRRLIIPPDLGYGHAGAPPTIPPNSTLIFDVELLRIG